MSPLVRWIQRNQPVARCAGSVTLGLLLLAPAFSADSPQPPAKPQYEIAPPPPWVEVMPLPAIQADATGASPGARNYLLVDRQVRFEDFSASYEHIAVQLLNHSGVESNSQFQVRFDPEQDRLLIHAVTVHRGAVTIDELKTGRIEILQREDGLEEGVLNGALTFHLLLNDLRVGDTLEYSYTLEHRDPEWGNRYFDRLTTRWDSPARHSRLRIWTKEHVPLYVLNHDVVQPTRQVIGGWQRLEWRWDELPAIVSVSDAPVGTEQHPSIELSQFANWSEVAAAAEPLFSVPEAESPERAALRMQFLAAGASEAERALAVMRFVQEEVRYTGIELGQGAYRPRTPDQVLAQRYGDCKDKALLAVTLLRSLGIEAAPVLVSTRWQRQLRQRLPSPGLMNHAIVRIRIGGAYYWFDATSTGQGGDLAHFTTADLEAGLVIAPGTTDLEMIPKPPADIPRLVVTEIFNLRDGIDHEGSLSVSTLYRGGEADAMRRKLRTTTIEELGRQYLNYYKGRYSTIHSAGALQTKDDPVANELVVNESYRITNLFELDEHGRMRFDVDGEAINSLLHAPADPVRTIPLGLKFPTNVVEQIEIRMPPDWPVKPEIENIDGPGFRFDARTSQNGDDVHLDYHYRVLAEQVPVDQLGLFLRKREQARLATYFSLSYNPSIIVSQAELDQAARDLEAARQLAAAGKDVELAKALDELMAEPGYPGLNSLQHHAALYMAGAAAFDRRDWTHALSYLQRSSAMDEAVSEEWQLRLRAAVANASHADAAQSLVYIAQRWPQSLTELGDALIGTTVGQTPAVGSGRYAVLNALAEAHYVPQDGADLSAWWGELGLLQLARGERDAALVTLRKVDRPYTLISLQADRRYEGIRALLGSLPDVATAAQLDIEASRVLAAGDARKLAPSLRLAIAQLTALHFAEALETLDALIVQTQQGPSHGGFVDFDREFPWVLDTRARALTHLGRWDEALAQLIDASHLSEQQSGNVSQVINLAGLYNELGRPREALAALEGLTSSATSAYGSMQVANETLSSALQLGDTAEAEKQFAFMREHSKDAIGTYQWALVNGERLDEAAQLLESRLANPDERVRALMEVQTYAVGALTPRDARWLNRWKAFLERPDVHEAITKVGSIGSYPVLSRGF
jgi:transglutaminase-like putative cysteine protease/tetratricopeptide (TPR) repeat protein